MTDPTTDVPTLGLPPIPAPDSPLRDIPAPAERRGPGGNETAPASDASTSDAVATGPTLGPTMRAVLGLADESQS